MVRLSMADARHRRGASLLAHRPHYGSAVSPSMASVPASSGPMRTRRGRSRRPMPTPDTTLQEIRKRRAVRTRPVAHPTRPVARPDPEIPRYVAPTPEQRTSERTIPRRIVQSWVNRNLTPGIVKLCRSHRDLNLGYEYVFYDDNECRQFLREKFDPLVLMAYDAIVPGAFKSDLFRYCELYLNGGWWFDIDTLSVAAIDVIVPAATSFASPRDLARSAGGLYQAVLGCERGSPALAAAIRAIVRKTAAAEDSTQNALGFTGPVLLGECVKRAGGGNHRLDGHSEENGQLLLGAGVLAVGHARLRKTHTQRVIEDAYAALRRRTPPPGGGGTYRWNQPIARGHSIQRVNSTTLDRLKVSLTMTAAAQSS